MKPPAFPVPSSTRTARRETVCLLAIFLGATIWNLPTLWFPYGEDQALAHVLGRLILDGGVLYRDAIDDKPPAIFYLYALFTALGGDGMHPVRMADLVCLWVTMFLVWQVGRRIEEPAAGLWGAFLLGLAHPLMGFWNTALQEGFLLPFLWGSLLSGLWAWQGGGKRWFLLCGASLGVVFWFKYPYALPLGIVGFAAAGKGLTARRWRAPFLGGSVMLGVGFLAVAAAGALYLWHIGALEEMIRITVSKNLWERFPYQGRALLKDAAVVWRWDWMAYVPFFLVLAASGGVGLLCLSGKGPAGKWLVGAYGLSMLVLIYLQMRFFQYHWIPLLAFLSLWTGLMIMAAARWLRRKGGFRGRLPGGSLAVGLAALVIAGALTTYATEFERWALLIRGRLSREAYFATFPGLGTSRSFVLEDWAAARTVDDMVQGEETLFVWGSRPLVYYFTGLRPASSFLYINHLHIPGPVGERFRQRLDEELQVHPPAVMLVVLRGNLAETFQEVARLAPGVHDMLTTRFTLGQKVGPFLVYERVLDGGER